MEDFVERDRELEAAHGRTLAELAEHRWHWTLDEQNPKRVTFAEYARGVGRAPSIVQAMAHGYVAWQKNRHVPVAAGAPDNLYGFIEQAKLGAAKAEATQAVAVASGKSFATVATSGRSEVREVLATAQDRAERRGTRVSDELPKVAQARAASQKATRERDASRRASAFRIVEFEGHLGAAVRRLRAALQLVRELEFEDEEVELIEGTIRQLRTLIELVDVRVTGQAGIDWDDEFAQIMEQAS